MRLLMGPLPTPGIAYITQLFRCNFGVVISASHNLYDDNGIKFFDGNGAKLSDELEERIEHRDGSEADDARFAPASVVPRASTSRAPSTRISALPRCRRAPT